MTTSLSSMPARVRRAAVLLALVGSAGCAALSPGEGAAGPDPVALAVTENGAILDRAPCVEVEEAQAFDVLLAQAGVPRKMVIYERDEHQLALHRAQWLAEVVDWFGRHGAFSKR